MDTYSYRYVMHTGSLMIAMKSYKLVTQMQVCRLMFNRNGFLLIAMAIASYNYTIGDVMLTRE